MAIKRSTFLNFEKPPYLFCKGICSSLEDLACSDGKPPFLLILILFFAMSGFKQILESTWIRQSLRILFPSPSLLNKGW